MPPGVTGWTWDGQGQSVAQGVAASMMSWGEFFPYFDDPEATKVSGLMEAARCPAPKHALRTVEETGFGEIPGVGHQGGSSPGGFAELQAARTLRGSSCSGQPATTPRC